MGGCVTLCIIGVRSFCRRGGAFGRFYNIYVKFVCQYALFDRGEGELKTRDSSRCTVLL